MGVPTLAISQGFGSWNVCLQLLNTNLCGQEPTSLPVYDSVRIWCNVDPAYVNIITYFKNFEL